MITVCISIIIHATCDGRASAACGVARVVPTANQESRHVYLVDPRPDVWEARVLLLVIAAGAPPRGGVSSTASG